MKAIAEIQAGWNEMSDEEILKVLGLDSKLYFIEHSLHCQMDGYHPGCRVFKRTAMQNMEEIHQQNMVDWAGLSDEEILKARGLDPKLYYIEHCSHCQMDGRHPSCLIRRVK